MNSGAPVVIGVDFTPVMYHAAPWVRDCIAPGAPIVLAHAVEPTEVPPFLRDLVPGEADHGQRERQRAEEHLREWGDRVGLPHAQLVVREGRADRVLRQAASDARAQLLVIGAHGAPLPPWRRLGTTAERLLRASECSLLVARGSMTEPPRRIVVAVDDVEITPKVLAIAGGMADRFGAELTAVHVLSEASYSHMLSAEAAEAKSEADKRARLEADIADEALRWLRALWTATRRHGQLDVEVPHGTPANEILRIAGERGADLIVMGRYGIGRVIPAILGSAVGSVVAGAECPVFVVAA